MIEILLRVASTRLESLRISLASVRVITLVIVPTSYLLMHTMHLRITYLIILFVAPFLITLVIMFVRTVLTSQIGVDLDLEKGTAAITVSAIDEARRLGVSHPRVAGADLTGVPHPTWIDEMIVLARDDHRLLENLRFPRHIPAETNPVDPRPSQ